MIMFVGRELFAGGCERVVVPVSVLEQFFFSCGLSHGVVGGGIEREAILPVRELCAASIFCWIEVKNSSSNPLIVRCCVPRKSCMIVVIDCDSVFVSISAKG